MILENRNGSDDEPFDELFDEPFDERHAWIVFRRRLRRLLQAQARRELRRPSTQSQLITADRTLLLSPLAADKTHD